MTAPTRTTSPTPPATRTTPLYSALIGLAALAVLLQGLWAGILLESRLGGLTAVRGLVVWLPARAVRRS